MQGLLRPKSPKITAAKEKERKDIGNSEQEGWRRRGKRQ